MTETATITKPERLRVLLLDDEPMILVDLDYAFGDAGYDTVIAKSCEAALDKIEGSPVQVAVLDVNLGRGKTCAPVAAHLAAHGIPFLLHTGDLDRHGEILRAFDVPIIQKPIVGARLVDKVDELLSRP